MRLVHTGRRWYLVAFDLDRDDWRTFRLDRVSDPVATGMRSRPRRGPDPVDLVQRGITIEAWDFRATVQLGVSAELAEREIAPTVGTIEPIDDVSSRLTIGADEIDWLVRYLLSMPFAFDVEEPAELRDALARVGSDLVRRFGS